MSRLMAANAGEWPWAVRRILVREGTPLRRSSWLVLITAVVLLTVAALLYVHSFNTTAPPMSQRVVESILERGRSAVERHDVGEIMDLMSPNARIMGMNPDQLRIMLNRSMKELGPGSLLISWKNLVVRPLHDSAEASLDLSIGQKTNSADIQYYDTHVDLQLEKVQTSHWFGLFHSEDWKILTATSDRAMEAPVF